MPVYKYTCDDCGHEWEKSAKVANRNVLQKCPFCGIMGQFLTISQTSFTLKGKGWAKDGYEKKQKN